MSAARQRFGAEDLEGVFAGASRVVVAKGKKVLDFDLRTDPSDWDGVRNAVLGPSGNLRAPTARVGKTWLVGFSEEVYGPVLGGRASE